MYKRHLDLLAKDMKNFRRLHGYTLQDVRRITGLAKNSVYSIEQNARTVLSVETIEIIARLFGITSTEFFDKYIALYEVPDEEDTKKDQ